LTSANIGALPSTRRKITSVSSAVDDEKNLMFYIPFARTEDSDTLACNTFITDSGVPRVLPATNSKDKYFGIALVGIAGVATSITLEFDIVYAMEQQFSQYNNYPPSKNVIGSANSVLQQLNMDDTLWISKGSN